VRKMLWSDAITAGICDRRNGVQGSGCTATILSCQCPLWVKSGHCRISARCPLYPQKRTSLSATGMSALCQKQTSAISFDFPIGGSEQRRWDVETQRFRSSAVDKKQEFRRLLYRKFVGSHAVQDLIDISCRPPRARVGIGPITEKGAFLCPRPKT